MPRGALTGTLARQDGAAATSCRSRDRGLTSDNRRASRHARCCASPMPPFRHHPGSALLLACALFATTAHAADCTRSSLGLVPLTDLAPGSYQASPGGLYPGGTNALPSAHAAALARAGAPLPLDAFRQPRSGERQARLPLDWHVECHPGVQRVPAARERLPTRNPRLVIVDCAFPGKTAAITSNPADPCCGPGGYGDPTRDGGAIRCP